MNAKAIENLLKSGKVRFNNEWKSLVNSESVLAHKDCWKTYPRPDTIKNILLDIGQKSTSNNAPVKDKLHSNDITKFKKNCLYFAKTNVEKN